MTDPEHDVVEIRVPADNVFVSTLRLTTASLAAQCDLTVDDIEDLTLAVDEACALLLPHATAASALSVSFVLADGALEVHGSVDSSDTAEPDRSGFAWTVLGALASTVDVAQRDGRLTISVTKKREAAQT